MKTFNKKTIPFYIFAFVLTFLSSCAKDEEVMTGTINGIVSDYTNANSPIAGATVTLSSKGLTKTTGSDGRFEFTDLEPGTYTLSVKANNYQATTKQITVYAGQKVNCDFQLEQEKVSIDISPMNLVFGKDIDQLSFSITNNSTRDLAYSISSFIDYAEVSPLMGTIKAKAIQSIGVKIKNRNTIANDQSGQILVNIGNDSYTVNLTINGTATTATTGKIAGIITDYVNTNTAISGANVSITSTGQTKTTGTDGRYEFDDLTPGKHTVSVSANGYETATKEVTVEAGKTTTCDIQLQKGSANVDVSPLNLNYASDVDQLSFTIKNNSSDALSYTISDTPDFAEVSSSNGMIAAKGSQAVKVTILNRKQITSKRNGQLTVNVGDNAYIVNISVEAYKEEALNIEITPQTLSFDKDTDQLSFTIKSNNSRTLDYSITSSLDILTVSPSSGTIKERGQSAVNVSIDNRNTIDVKRTGQLTITIEESTFIVNVNVDPYVEPLDVMVNPTSLTFDKATDQLSFTISSNNSRSLDYTVRSNLDIITLSPSSGTITSKGNCSISVNVKDRNNVTEDKNGQITISIEENTYTISVSIAKAKDAGSNPSGETDVTRGLQAYYTFDDGTANDSRNGYNGVFNGGSMIKDSPSGSGNALFLKKGESVSIPYTPLDGKKNYTVSFWLKDFGTGYPLRSYNDYLYGPSVFITEEMKLRIYTGVSWSSDNYNTFSSNLSSYQSEKWTLITIVTNTSNNSSQGTNILYINGQRINTGTSYTNNNTGAISMAIGGNSSDPMKIDNLRLYSVALKDDEVLNIYNSEK